MDVNSNSLSVSCVLSGSELMGYVVVVHSAADTSTLLIGESRLESAVELEGMSDAWCLQCGGVSSHREWDNRHSCCLFTEL